MNKKYLLFAGALIAGIGLSYKPFVQDTYAAAPESFDLRVSYYTRVGIGTELWAYTPSGGGITQMVYWAQEAKYWRSYVEDSFFASEFTWQLRIPRSVDNDALFSLVAPGKYKYISPDGNLSYYRSATFDVQTLIVTVNDSDYRVLYKRDINSNYSGVLWASSTNEFFYTVGTLTRSFSYNRSDVSLYTYFSTFSTMTYIECDPGVSIGNLSTYTNAFYFKLSPVTNIEGQDWYDIWQQGNEHGFGAGYDQGFIDGYHDGLSTGLYDEFPVLVGDVLVSLGTWFDIEVFPGIKLGALIFAPVVFGLIFVVIKKIGG